MSTEKSGRKKKKLPANIPTDQIEIFEIKRWRSNMRNLPTYWERYEGSRSSRNKNCQNVYLRLQKGGSFLSNISLRKNFLYENASVRNEINHVIDTFFDIEADYEKCINYLKRKKYDINVRGNKKSE